MKREYKILLLASLLANFGANLIGPFYAVFVQDIGGSILDIGYTISIFSIAAGVLIIGVGKLSDKINRELITVIGYYLFALGSLGYLVISTPNQLFILQIVFALGTACLAAPLKALFARFIQKGEEGLQWGLEDGGSYIVVGVAVFIGTLVVNYFGFTVLFLSMFVIQSLAAIIQTRFYIRNYYNYK
jgi:MFS family permease